MNGDGLAPGTHTVVLVEGDSDHNAVVALARRTGRDLASEGIAVVAMGGATNIAHFMQRYGPAGLDLGVAGLCDVAEVGYFERALRQAGPRGRADRRGRGPSGPAAGQERNGISGDATRLSARVLCTGEGAAGLEATGFFVCESDLEDELIRALGTDAMLRFIEGCGELGGFRIMQRQLVMPGRCCTIGQSTIDD